MDCAEIRDAFVRGEVLPEARVREHLKVCPHCSELFEHGAQLGRSLAENAQAAVALPEELLLRLEASVARETGVRAWLRSRPTRLRFKAAALSVGLLVTAAGLMRPRGDFAQYSRPRLFSLLGVYLLGIAVAFSKELYTSARRSAFGDYSWLVLGALGLPFLVAFAPATEAASHFGPGGALGCFSYGALLTVPTAALLWALDRDDRPALRTVCLSAAALGLTANLVLELHCPSGNLQHLLLGHASIGLAWLATWYALRRVSRA